MKLMTIMIRKPSDYEDLKASTKMMIMQLHAEPEKINIDRVIELDAEEFQDFKNQLYKDRKWLKNTGGEILLVVKKGSEPQTGIIVQSSGFDYARYAGLPIEEAETHKCPRCGKYYLGHPAISRKDNKTEICSACGIEEALIQAGFDSNLINALDQLQETADKFQIKITVEKPGQGKKKAETIVIKPQNK